MTLTPLTQNTLDTLRAEGRLPVPEYDRSTLATGIVHFGVGNFHRAHQAMVIDSLLRQGLAADWAICGVGVLPSDSRMRDALTTQDGLYVLRLKHPDGSVESRVIGSITDYLFAPDDPQKVIARLASADTKIVSLTVTEGGYNVDQASGEFDTNNADVQHDVAHPDQPKTVFGLVVAALRQIRDAGTPPFTVMSCDNLPGNGYVAQKMFCAFARLQDPELAEWIERTVHFPNSMVDRITPATTAQDVARVGEDLGIEDAWPVTAEPFFQWVLEDDFSRGRPPFERAGVQLVEDVEPYELMKLRLLNVSHQAMAYFGYLAGYEHVHEAMEDEALRGFVLRYMDEEATPTLQPVPGVDLDAYKDTLLDRFGNPEVRDTLARLCADASDRIPKWLVPEVRENIAAGRPVTLSAAICASWARYAEGIDENGDAITIVDTRAAERTAAARRFVDDPLSFLRNESLFGDLASHPQFTEPYLRTLASLHEKGSRMTFTPTTRPEIVVFDLGEVLASPKNLFVELADIADVAPSALEAAYWEHRDLYDRGGDTTAFWRAVLDTADAPASTDDLIAVLDERDITVWTDVRPGAASILAELARRETRIGILSNAPRSLAALARTTAWGEHITDWFFSGELELAKPDPQIYAAVTEATGVSPEAVVFVDDRQVNVDAARATGWNAFLWTSDDATETQLRTLGLL